MQCCTIACMTRLTSTISAESWAQWHHDFNTTYSSCLCLEPKDHACALTQVQICCEDFARLASWCWTWALASICLHLQIAACNRVRRSSALPPCLMLEGGFMAWRQTLCCLHFVCVHRSSSSDYTISFSCGWISHYHHDQPGSAGMGGPKVSFIQHRDREMASRQLRRLQQQAEKPLPQPDSEEEEPSPPTHARPSLFQLLGEVKEPREPSARAFDL